MDIHTARTVALETVRTRVLDTRQKTAIRTLVRSTSRTQKTSKTVSTIAAAALFGVDPVTAARWCDQGILRCYKTPGGHRKIYRSSVDELLKKQHAKKSN